MEVGVQRARIILAGIEKENGWFRLSWKWDPCSSGDAAVVCPGCHLEAASVWVGDSGGCLSGGIWIWCSRGGLPGPPAAGRGFGTLGGGVGGTGPKAPGPCPTSHWESKRKKSHGRQMNRNATWPAEKGGSPLAVPRRTQVEQGHGHLDQPGVTWWHGGIHPGRCLSGDALHTQPPLRTGQLWDLPQLPGQVLVK